MAIDYIESIPCYHIIHGLVCMQWGKKLGQSKKKKKKNLEALLAVVNILLKFYFPFRSCILSLIKV